MGDEAANAGGEQGKQEQQQQAAAPDLNKVLEGINTLATRLQTQEQALATVLAAQTAGQQQGQQQQDQGFVDPEIAKVAKHAQAQDAVLGNVEDKLDALEFRTRAAELGLSADEQQMTEQLYSQWRQQGQPVKRVQAMTVVLANAETQRRKTGRDEAAKAEQQRRAQNEQAFTETGGHRQIAGLPDPEKLSRSERLEKYYPAVLDTDGF